MSTDPQGVQHLPPYEQIASHYQARIMKGELSDGAVLPSARDLADTWKTTPNTAGRALSRLQALGLVRVTPRGAVVTVEETSTYSPKDRLNAAYDGHGSIYPLSDKSRVVRAELAQAPDHVADALGIEPRTPVVRRTRVTYHGTLPVTLSTSWLPSELATAAPALLDTDRIEGGTLGLIHQLTGRKAVKGVDVLCARGASGDVSKLLSCGEGAPVLYGRNMWMDADGIVIEYGEFWVPADRQVSYQYPDHE